MSKKTSHNQTNFSRQFAEIKSEIRGVGGLVEHVSDQLRAVAEQVVSNSEQLAVIKDDMEIVKSNLKQKVDYDEFESLARRVSVLERRARK